jgi:hypothetical protein
MALYTVHIPLEARGPEEAADEAVFIKDGFNPVALVFTGLWLLAKRLWLGFAVFAVVTLLLALLIRYAGLPAAVAPFLNSLLALYLGLQGNDLLREKLAASHRHAGSVTGQTLEECERRFFEGFDASTAPPALAAFAAPPAPAAGRPGARPGVLGLFPQAGGRG